MLQFISFYKNLTNKKGIVMYVKNHKNTLQKLRHTHCQYAAYLFWVERRAQLGNQMYLGKRQASKNILIEDINFKYRNKLEVMFYLQFYNLLTLQNLVL